MPQQKYRDHKITYEAKQIPGSKYWLGKADVEIDDGGAVRILPFTGPFDKYSSQEEAEQQILEAAKNFIDGLILK